jgi:lysophospholipid acyltransferase (LPLAT)-like uncharacterized protein
VHLPFAARHTATLLRAANRMLRASVRWSVVDPQENLRAATGGEAVLFVCLHGQLWPLLWAVRPAHIGVMISRSADGELLSRVLGDRDYRFLRGSTSRDGSLAARLCIRELRRGRSVGLAVDGPRGPRGVVQEGVLRIAQRTGIPLVPMRVTGSGRCVVPRSWDAFEIPRPGGSLEVVVGPRALVGASELALRDARDAVASALGVERVQPVWPAAGGRLE